MINVKSIAQETSRLGYILPFKDALRLYKYYMGKRGFSLNDESDSAMLRAYTLANRDYNPKLAKPSTYFLLLLKHEIAECARQYNKFTPHISDSAQNLEELESITYNWDDWIEYKDRVERLKAKLTPTQLKFLELKMQGLRLCEIAAKLEWSEQRAFEVNRRIRELYQSMMRVPNAKIIRDKNFCKHGHELNEINSFISSEGRRRCKICRRISERAYKERKNAEKNYKAA